MLKIQTNKLLTFYHCQVPDEIHPISSMLNLDVQESNIISDIFYLIDLPNNGQCVAHMQPIVEWLIVAYSKESGADIKSLIVFIEKVWNYINTTAGLSPLWGFNKSSKIRKKNPIFTFCFLGSSAGSAVAIPVTGVSTVFMAFGPYLLRSLWKIKSEKVNDIYENSLAARKLAVMPMEVELEKGFELDEFEKLRIAKFAQNFVHGDKMFFTENDMVYVRRILFSEDRESRTTAGRKNSREEVTERDLLWLPFEKENSFAIHEPYFDDSDELDSGNGFYPEVDRVSGTSDVEVVVELRTKNRSYKTFGEYDGDYKGSVSIGFPAKWFDPWKAKSGERGKIEAMTYSTVVMPWDKVCLSSSTLNKIVGSFRTQLLKPSCGIIAMTLLMGMPLNTLKKLRWLEKHDISNFLDKNSKKLIDGSCYIDKSKGCIWNIAERSEERPEYYKIPDIISLKLPGVLIKQLPVNGEVGDLIFSAEDFKIAARYMTGFGKDLVSTLSLARLRKTFQAYFVCGAGLPELWADMLAFQPSFHLNSQRFYVTSSLRGLEDEWHRMVDEFVSGIQNGLSTEHVLEKMSFKTSALSLQTDSYIGASCTPNRKAVIGHFNVLWRHFPHSISELLKASGSEWNAYLGYLHGCIELGTAKRPERDPKISMSTVRLNLDAIFIADKNNRKYSEARFLPLCSTLTKILRIHADIQKNWVEQKICQGYSLEGSINSLLLIDNSTRSLVPFNQNTLDELLDGVVDDGYMRGARNAFRHFLITRLHSAGFDQFQIDFMAGHRRHGMEPEFLTSPVRWTSQAKELSEFIEIEVFHNLGLKKPVNDL